MGAEHQDARKTPANHWRQVWRRRTAKYSRWLHIYVSMASFVVVFFFALTGLTLNHTEWFGDAARTRDVTGSIAPAMAGAAETQQLQIVETLRSTQHVTGAVSDFRIDDREVSVAFKGPGYTADAVIDRQTGAYTLSESRLGIVAVMNDLHKGRDSGAAWGLVIDISAVLLTTVSLTGLVLLYFIHKHRTAGLILLAAGGMVLGLVYAAWVP